MSIPRILIIAGSDSGGGAGIQADIKTVTALGGYAATAITAITVQNTQGVKAVHVVPAEIVAGQIKAVMEDIGADAIKTGMLLNEEIIRSIPVVLDSFAVKHFVLDPVMVAKGGAHLLEDAAVNALTALLLPRAALLTPNIPEAEVLSGVRITTREEMKKAAFLLKERGAKAVLIKGGHLETKDVEDIFLDEEGRFHHFIHPRIATRHTHGTGCTLASAIATHLARDFSMKAAIEESIAFVEKALRNPPGFGQGHGPLNHGYW